MQITVTTPTGNVGRHLVGMLLRAGVRPRAPIRDPARLDPAVRARVDAVAVDLNDADAVVRSTAGTEALYRVAPSATSEDPIGRSGSTGRVPRCCTCAAGSSSPTC